MTLGLLPERALLNDANPHLINFYRWLQRGLHVDLAMENDEALFYRHRAGFNALLADGQGRDRRSRRAVLLPQQHRATTVCADSIVAASSTSRSAGTRASATRATSRRTGRVRGAGRSRLRDVEDVPLERGDFVYADPPYDVDFTHYSKGGFCWEDQERTAGWLAKHRGPVVLVNQATPRVERLYRHARLRVRFPRCARAASAAPATGHPPARSSLPATSASI